MKVLIVGAGAVGGVLAGALARSGHDVMVVARGAHAEAIGYGGLTFHDVNERSSTHRLRVVSCSEEVAGDADMVLVTMKAHSLAAATSSVVQVAGNRTPLFVQNGLPWWYLRELLPKSGGYIPGDPSGILGEAFPNATGAVVHFGAVVENPGVVRCTAPGAFRVSNTCMDPRSVKDLTACLRDVGIQTDVVPSLGPAIWAKLVVNTPLNAIAALTGATILELLTDLRIRSAIMSLSQEVSSLAAKVGITALLDLESQICITRSGQKSSTLQDLEAGKDIEFGALFEAPLWLADHYGCPMPGLRLIAPLLQLRSETALKSKV